ncbi:hypothetical protein [Chryseobacterium sp. FH1]|uniref:hypothetical protein n=1 Tax=Chryseobacterium sp. FH1 TaxID=1233951 RepID=UPI0004E38E12|nr:hypothetical protein [Chryseobacterium sp. FH1]KFC24332.1 hypothetical protein IO90_03250 [Chryseobacterium sp. FH1]
MNRRFQILIGIISIIVFGFFILFIFTNDFKRKITVLDCEGVYYKKLFEKPKPGFIDFRESNVKMDIANCLCEKYNRNKSENYKTEVLKIIKSYDNGERLLKNLKSIDTICKRRNEIFIKSYDL